MQASNIIQTLAESATLGISKKVRALKAEGKDVIGLTLGEPDFDTPVHICEAAKQALDDGYTHYPPVAGLPELRQAIADKLQRENGLPYSTEHIVVSTGAKQSLYNVVMALINPGDEVVVPAPYWVSYTAMIHLAEGKAVVVPTSIESAYKISPEQLEEAITPQTRLLMMSTPSNPTGSMYSQEELAALVEVLERHPQVVIISDEIYEHLTFGPEHVSFASFESIFDRVVTVNGFSKGYAMTGWRLGYIAAPQQIARLCEKLQGQCTSGANSFAQKGAVAALNGSMQPTFDMLAAFRKRRDYLFEALQKIEGLKVILPDGAFYFYPDLTAFIGKSTPEGQVLEDIEALCLYLIDSVGLALVPGTAFGTNSHVRISYAYAMNTLQDAVIRLEKGLKSLS
ncbi:MAG: pyridoxal phosphate-dependent aminotransferase [Bacteroidota bacterium]